MPADALLPDEKERSQKNRRIAVVLSIIVDIIVVWLIIANWDQL